AEFSASLADDLNVSGAQGALFRMVREVNAALDRKEVPRGTAARVEEVLARAGSVLGVIARREDRLDPGIAAPIDRRTAGRAARTGALVMARGIVLGDTRLGVRWRRAAPGSEPPA